VGDEAQAAPALTPGARAGPGHASEVARCAGWPSLRQAAVSGIRARHPEYDDEQVHLAYARLVLGDALTRAAWPRHDLVDP
jgi:hypothetical protein